MSGVRPSGQTSRVDVPVAEPCGVVAATAEPAVVEDEPLDADLGADVGEGGQPGEVVVEVDGLPSVEHHRTRRGRVVRARPQVVVEGVADAVQPARRPGGVRLRARRAPRPGARTTSPEAEQLGGAEDGVPVWAPLGPQPAVAAPAEVHAPHLARAVAEARRAGREHAGWRRCPVRPRRCSRTNAPCTKGCRCGCRSRSHRPVRSSSSPARAGSGSTLASSSSAYGSSPSLRRTGRSCSSPPGCRCSSRRSGEAAPWRRVASTTRLAVVVGQDPVEDEGGREVATAAAARQPGPAAVARRPLGQQRDGDRHVERGVGHGRHGGVRDRLELVGGGRAEVGPPGDDRGQAGSAGVEQQAGAGAAQVHQPGAGRPRACSGAALVGPAHPFVAPSVSPPMNCFCSRK